MKDTVGWRAICRECVRIYFVIIGWCAKGEDLKSRALYRKDGFVLSRIESVSGTRHEEEKALASDDRVSCSGKMVIIGWGLTSVEFGDIEGKPRKRILREAAKFISNITHGSLFTIGGSLTSQLGLWPIVGRYRTMDDQRKTQIAWPLDDKWHA